MRLINVSSACVFSFLILVNFQNCSQFKSAKMNSIENLSAAITGSVNPFFMNRSVLSSSSSNAGFGNGSISSSVLGSTLTISTTARLAGAIGSLTWNGKEFINQDDHGRELQSASSFDGFGECLNPTEAGSSSDGAGPATTSNLLGYSASGNQLKTTTQMAFWLKANEDYVLQNSGAGCGGNAAIKKAQNTSDISNDLLYKQVTIGYSNISNVIEYLVTFRVNESHQTATFEAVTGYLGKDFSSFWTYDPGSGKLNTLSTLGYEQNLPIIFSTTDKNHAMGIYSPDLPQAPFLEAGYGRFNFEQDNTMKWNAVYRKSSVPAGDYSFRQYVIVGTLADVQNSMKQLHNLFYPVVPPPVAPPVVVNPPVVVTPPVVVPPTIVPPTLLTQNNFRFYNSRSGEHFITSNYNEGINAHYIYEGIAFKSFDATSSVENTKLIFRCYVTAAGKHFVSSDVNCEGFSQEGALGKIYSSQIAGASPLYRFYNSLNRDHLITVNLLEGNSASGYVLEGLLGYVP